MLDSKTLIALHKDIFGFISRIKCYLVEVLVASSGKFVVLLLVYDSADLYLLSMTLSHVSSLLLIGIHHIHREATAASSISIC